MQELGAIERPPAEASTSEAEANAMGCCNIDCLDYSDAALGTKPLHPPLATACRFTPLLAHVTALFSCVLPGTPIRTTVRLHLVIS